MSYYGNSKRQSMVQSELEHFVEAAGGEIITPYPGELPEGEYYIPQDQQWDTGTRENPGNPWAPQPPYFGEQLANLVSHTPFDRGMSPDVYEYLPEFEVVQPWKPIYGEEEAEAIRWSPQPNYHPSGIPQKRNFGSAYGFWNPKAPKAPINQSSTPAQIQQLAKVLSDLGYQIPATHSTYDATMINAVKALQVQFGGMTQASATGVYNTTTQGLLEQVLKGKTSAEGKAAGMWALQLFLDQMGGSTDQALPQEIPQKKETNWGLIIGVGAGAMALALIGTALIVRK